MPFANWKGAACGMIVSHISIFFLTLGRITFKKSSQFLETSINGCTNETFSSHTIKPENAFWMLHKANIGMIDTPSNGFSDGLTNFPGNIFSISYMYYVCVGTLITVTLGILISSMTRSSDDAYDSKLIHPGIFKLTKYLSHSDNLFTEPKTNSDNTRCEFFMGSMNLAIDGEEKNI